MPRRILRVWLPALAVRLVLLAAGTVWSQQAPVETRPTRSSEARIEYYRAKLREDPAHYPSQALLGAACLDKARETNDPQWLAESRAALERSMEIQPNLAALKQLAALANYRHRFEEALQWAARAALTAPGDTSITAMRVEAELALGRVEEARKLLRPPEDDFYLNAAQGHVLLAEGHEEHARESFLKAASVAERQKVVPLAVWATVRSAGVLIDSGKVDAARPLLQAAARLDSTDRFLRIHQCEVLEADGEHAAALDAYEELLKEQPDPELHRRALLLAKKLGCDEMSQQHFVSAEKLLQAPIERGEVYSLEGLATLYCDAQVQIDQACSLAERNLQFKRDQSARDLRRRALQLRGRGE